ncbi:dihydroorotate dehydrogenase-like protein [Puteibacter caeruleilacunae]|nr:dihydroorotate dehydrogenase-like protein [Puteibacter caeruleilacunae]
MVDLKTSFMGIELKNPFILGASNLVTKPEIIKQLEEAGISAIVYKSLFEEQINLESIQFDEELNEYANRNPESAKIFPTLKHAGPKEHLLKLKTLKESVSIPVFASLNAVYDETWVEYAQLLQETGIDGLEINFYAIPGDFDSDAVSIEKKQLEIIKKLKKAVSIPISVKLSPFYTNALNFIKKLDDAGVNGFTLFNRFFQPEINTGEEDFYYPFDLSKDKDYQLTLRYTGLLYDNIKGSICSTRGIYEAHQAIKLLLAGADVVQIVSTIYKNGPEHVSQILFELSTWMEKKGYQSLADFKGKLSKANLKNPYAYDRAQYVDILMNSEQILKIGPMI